MSDPCLYSQFRTCLPFQLAYMMMPWKFCDDVSNGSGVIMLTNEWTNKQRDRQTHRHYWKRCHLRCTGHKNQSLCWKNHPMQELSLSTESNLVVVVVVMISPYEETKMSRRDEEFHQTLNPEGSISPSWQLTGASLKGGCRCPQLMYRQPLSNDRCGRMSTNCQAAVGSPTL